MSEPRTTDRSEPFFVDEVDASDGLVGNDRGFRAKAVLTLAMFASSILIFTLGSALAGSRWLLPGLLVRTALAVLGVALCYAIDRVLRRLAGRRFRTRAIVAAALAPLAAELFAWATYFAFQMLHGKALRFEVSDWNEAATALSLWTWFFVAWAGLYLAIEYEVSAREEARRAADLREAAQEAKLRALANQVNPHFLFNSLNSISALMIDGRIGDSERMLSGLSTYLRKTLALDPLVQVPLEQEFDLHRQYLSIEQMRYPDLEVEVDLPNGLRRAAVPALITQPLVENAIKHGVSRSLAPTRIEIAARAEGKVLRITIADCGRSMLPRANPGASGIGIANIRQRLATSFGDSQSLEFFVEPARFCAEISLPLVRCESTPFPSSPSTTSLSPCVGSS